MKEDFVLDKVKNCGNRLTFGRVMMDYVVKNAPISLLQCDIHIST